MKPAIILAGVALVATTILSCNRATVSDPGMDATTVTVPNKSVTHNNYRIVGSDYSQPIALDTANKMIGSYLQSIGYPSYDTSIRSLAFDADTLRAYLTNTNITTVKFYFGHQLSYLDGGSNRFGKNVGMKPGAMTIICVGVDDNGAVVKNSTNGVYEHAMPCPNSCGLEVDAFLH